MTPTAKQAIQYVINTGGNCTVAIFDEDHEPIGPELRQEIMPEYVREDQGKLYATEAGRALAKIYETEVARAAHAEATRRRSES